MKMDLDGEDETVPLASSSAKKPWEKRTLNSLLKESAFDIIRFSSRRTLEQKRFIYVVESEGGQLLEPTNQAEFSVPKLPNLPNRLEPIQGVVAFDGESTIILLK
ncbi:uncharacterized protein IL334_003048 [Kwoniella shivajii]|uniref:Uncharacterized protein n=1 Tax=Kwoniella shivajii TaxID=564305 RepID=A0ABZ1CY55_9TREE|nr:hypothetical protein IL334_003048 [Kwoniella shivajii]